jgi:biopolymer transport protein ExbD/biopolymer transport protein TolR
MKKKTAGAIVSDINVTPMVDVMLVLLIIFMVITPMLSKGQTVDLTKAKNAIAMKEADAEDAIMVAITRDNKTFLMPGNEQVAPEEIVTKVRDLLTGRVDKTVYIKADQRAKYGMVEDVVDFLRGAGVDELGLLTESVQKAPDAAEAK